MALRKVMIVDDDDDVRTLSEHAVRRDGHFDVVSAASGEQALALAARERPDVILLDLVMPGMDGTTTLARLREIPATANTPVIFLTGKAQREETDRYFALGASGVIFKPFEVEALADEIRGIVDGRPVTPRLSPEPDLAGLRRAYRRKLPTLLGELEALLQRARDDPGHERLDTARAVAHRLKGTTGSYGLLEISELLEQIEASLERQLQQVPSDAGARRDEVGRAASRVRAWLTNEDGGLA